MIRFSPGPQAPPKVGDLLMSEPFLEDPYFGRKVVLLCEHGNEGSFGFVLNNAVDLDLHSVATEIPEGFANVSVGGPVNVSTLYYLHRDADLPGAIPVVEGLWMGGDFQALQARINANRLDASTVRFFVGYAGWEGQQLEEEIQSRSWFIGQADIDTIMDASVDGEDYWKQRIGDLGEGFSHIANSPSNPSLN